MELIRYIHLNPLRAGLVKDLKELYKYPWTGHSAILGKRNNPLMPNRPDKPNEPNKPDRPDKPLAEKTIEDVLLHFGDTLNVARRRYRQFVKNGIDQGTRPELQGGGLVRSAGGNKRGLLGRKREEKGDERILGSGEFVENILADSEKIEGYKFLRKVSLSELVEKVSTYLDADKDEVLSGNRRQKNCHARGLISFLAAKSMGYKFNDIAEILGIHPVTAGRCAEKGKKLIDKNEGIWNILEKRS